MSINQSIYNVTKLKSSKIILQSNFTYREICIETKEGKIRFQLFAKTKEQLTMKYSGKWAFE